MRKLPYINTTELEDFWNKFTKTRIYDAWHETTSEAPKGEVVGLVFDWPGIHGGPMIIHDWAIDYDENETTIVRRLKDRTLYIQRFEPLLDYILKRYWDPGA